MSEAPSNSARNRFLLTSLGIIFIFILTLLVLLAAYPLVLAPPATLTPTITLTRTITLTPSLTPTITQTPRPTATRRPTFTPTATLTASLTPQPSQTPTPIGPPTLTPARPIIGEDLYSLLPWSPEKADQVIALVGDYPNTLPRQARGEQDENYYSAFQHAVMAYSEVLLRFPDAPQADRWRWALAYSLARAGDPRSGDQYAQLVATALNRQETDLKKLPVWFQDKQPGMEIEVTEVKPLPGYLSTHLVHLDQAGGTIFLLLETPAGFQSEVLVNTFDFVNPAPLDAFNTDLTGDGIEEVVVYSQVPTSQLTLEPPRVFDLSASPYVELAFRPDTADFPLGTEFSQNWSADDRPNQGNMLHFDADLFPSCPLSVSRSYAWNGEWFEASPPEFLIQPNRETLAYCEPVLEHAYREWGAGTAIPLADALLADWPPEKDLNGDPYPADAKDELRYRLGIYHALNGDFEQATQQLNALIDGPTSSDSRWIEPARQFLEIYRSPQDLYRACITQAYCAADQALSYLVESFPADQYPQLLSHLWQMGVAQRSSGYYDFDGDGTNESWITVQHRPGEKLEFWILANYPQGIKAFLVDTLNSNLPDLIPYQEGDIPPVTIVNGETAFQMNRLPGTLLPYLTYPQLPQFWPNRFTDGLEAALADLFSGASPEDIQQRLIDLQTNPGLLCQPSWSCDRYYYGLALASELADDPQTAIEYLLKLWFDYSKSPYTTMARLRLKGPAFIPSATPTITLTLAITNTPTVTGTPPTATPTPDPNATQTPTPTVLPSATPYPAP